MSEENQDVTPLGPGAMLREARERAGLTQEQIADKLHLRSSNIADIEAENFGKQISLTFYKGYVKLYAREVNLPADKVVEAFENAVAEQKEPAKLQSFSKRVAKQNNDQKLMLVTYLVIFVVVALVVIWWFQQTSPKPVMSDSRITQQASEQVADSSEQGETNEVAPQEAPAEAIAEEDDEEVLAPFETESAQPSHNQKSTETKPAAINASTTTQSQSAQTVSAKPSAELGEKAELIFEFKGDCWMNLADATGENIAYGVKAEGRVMAISGYPPFEVTLGAPEAVNISLDGKPVDMSQFRKGRVAKFSLPLESE